jgi:hypothetical protein
MRSQKRGVRDFVFVALLAFAVVVSLSSVAAAVDR